MSSQVVGPAPPNLLMTLPCLIKEQANYPWRIYIYTPKKTIYIMGLAKLNKKVLIHRYDSVLAFFKDICGLSCQPQ